MTAEIKTVGDPRLRLEILSQEDVSRLHAATLEVIEQTGVRFPSSRAMAIWEVHGATVDQGSMVVKASGQLIEEALAKAPPAYSLTARNPAQDLPLDPALSAVLCRIIASVETA